MIAGTVEQAGCGDYDRYSGYSPFWASRKRKELAVKMVVIGRGNVGGGLTRLWRSSGHDAMAVGREGGDASDADVVVVAVPGDSIADALSKVTGLAGKTSIDATNSLSGPREGFPSLAAEVKSIIGGPTAKSFNTNFAAICLPAPRLMNRAIGDAEEFVL